MCTLKIPKTVIDQIDKYRKHCLWSRFDINAKQPPMVAWKVVSQPKSNGGLGVIDLAVQNDSLLLLSLRKFFNWQDIPWLHLIWQSYYRNSSIPTKRKKCSFWWRTMLSLLDTYKAIATVEMKHGSTILLWKDIWSGSVH